jgi:glycosyltransferase involved in cell wall biosynthesis
MTISVIVPTKNRPHDLALAMQSLVAQTRLPDEIIVVDQSEDGGSELSVKALLDAAALKGVRLELRYVRDPAIVGANAARNVGMRMAKSEIVALIEDDIVLERFALERLLQAYERYPELLGMSGAITNYGPPSRAFRLFDRIFTLGAFTDDRQPLYWGCDDYGADEVVPITQMGGLMTWRASAIVDLAFDETPKALRVRGEDRDFCFMTSGRAGRGRRVFGMAMGARLAHNPSPVGRFRGRLEELKAVSQHWFYRRHLSRSPVHTLLYAWWNVGLVLSAVVAALRGRSLEPVRALGRGWRHIARGYLRSAT